jgi:Family of unknown function (DUF6166)
MSGSPTALSDLPLYTTMTENPGPVVERLYSGRKDSVIVRENGQWRPLAPRLDLDSENSGDFAWGEATPAGKRLALAMLADALGNDDRAVELAEIFNNRVVAILPERWTMTRARVVSHADLMFRESIQDRLHAWV